MHSNFVTPPDIITAKKHTVLLVDPVWQDIEAVAMICKTIGTDFNVYIYDETMNDIAWLNTVADKSDTVVINTEPTQCSPIKDKLADLDKSYYYGPKNFLSNTKRIANPQEYFINYARQQSSTPAL
jgi:hypothetical protein